MEESEDLLFEKFYTLKVSQPHDLPDNGRLVQSPYAAFLDDALMDIPNELNKMAINILKLNVWMDVMRDHPDQRENILFDFIFPIAHITLMSPYTIKQRFFFWTAHLSHQANLTKGSGDWVDDFNNLPADKHIKEEHANRASKDWLGWKPLIKCLNRIDASDYKKQTGDYRNSYTHRYSPAIEIGCNRFYTRHHPQDLSHTPEMKDWASGRIGPVYGLGGSKSLPVGNIVDSCSKQLNIARKSYRLFRVLAEEQLQYLLPNRKDGMRIELSEES